MSRTERMLHVFQSTNACGAERIVQAHFRLFAASVTPEMIDNFFDGRNADTWVVAFGHYLIEEQRKCAAVRASND